MDTLERIDQILKSDPATATDDTFRQLRIVWAALRNGSLRAANKHGSAWSVNLPVKEIILWAFKAGNLTDIPVASNESVFSFTDKHTFPIQKFTAKSGQRIVPGGTTVRDGSYLAPGVIIMPPAYVNVGAFVDEETLIDSHALVGSCAQIGKHVHISAGVQIGGVLEPVGAIPVVIEDNVLIGGNCGIYEGTIVRQGAVIGTGVILNKSTPVYDLVTGVIHRTSEEHGLEIPENAVVVQGSRPAKGSFAEMHNVHLYTPVIVKYRDEKTDAGAALEESLR